MTAFDDIEEQLAKNSDTAQAPPPLPAPFSKRQRRLITLLCLLAVVLADILFYQQPLGWTTGIYASILILFLVVADRTHFIRTRAGAVLFAAAAGLTISLVYQPDPLGIILVFTALASFALAARSGWVSDAGAWADRWLRFAVGSWTQIVIDGLSRSHVENDESDGGGVLLKRLLMLTPVVVLALVFIGLFAAANPVISNWLKQLGEIMEDFLSAVELPTAGRIFMWLVAATYCWALLRFRTPGRVFRMPVVNNVVFEFEEFFLNPQTIMVGLAIFNVIFAIQNILDISYLWGGAALPEGMTYAEYAQRGAYPLVATALLAAAFMLITFRQDCDSRHGRIARGLVYLWIGQNVFLTVSAGWRLNLYVEVYSLTYLRVAAAIWMLLVALGLVWICVRIVAKRSNIWLINANALTLITVLYLCAFVNFAGIIAWYNVRHCREVTGHGATLDVRYLRILGPEALPALQWLQNEVQDPAKIPPTTNAAIQRLERQLARKMEGWRGWTWRRARLMEVTGANKTAPLQKPEPAPYMNGRESNSGSAFRALD